MAIGMLVVWRGETVTIVSLRDHYAQIARPKIGLRWVLLSSLEKL